MRCVVALGVLLGVGCYRPDLPAELACGPGGLCPSGRACAPDNRCVALADVHDAGPDADLFEVLSTVPGSGETGVEPGADIVITLSDPVAPATVSDVSLVVSSSSGVIAGVRTLEQGGTRLRFHPSQPLAFARPHQVALTTALTDLGGRPLTPYSFSFTVRDRRWSAPVNLGTSLGQVDVATSQGMAMAVWWVTNRIQGALFDGTRWGVAVDLEPGQPATGTPRVAMDGSNITVVFTKLAQGVDSAWAIRRPTGLPWQAPVLLEQNALSVNQIRVASYGTRVVATWTHGSAPNNAIWAAIFEADAWRPAVQVAPGNNAIGLRVVGSADHALISWQQDDAGTPVSYAARVVGSSVGAPVPVRVMAASSTYPCAAIGQEDLVAFGSGASRQIALGTSTGAGFSSSLVQTSTGAATVPWVAADATRRLVAWTEGGASALEVWLHLGQGGAAATRMVYQRPGSTGGEAKVAIDGDEIHLFWVEATTLGNPLVRASHRSLSGADFGPPADLAANNDYVVAARDGEAFVVSTSGTTVVAFHFE